MAGTVPVNKELLAGTVPVNKELLTGRVPVNNLFLKETKKFWKNSLMEGRGVKIKVIKSQFH